MLPEEARNGFFAAQAEKLPVKHVADADEIAEAVSRIAILLIQA